MKLRIKHLTALLLALALSLSLFSINAWAAGDAKAQSAQGSAAAQEAALPEEPAVTPQVDLYESGTCGESAKYELQMDGDLIIRWDSDGPGQGMCPMTKTFPSDSRIKRVLVYGGISSLPNMAFQGCRNLREVAVSAGVPLTSIGFNAFWACTSLHTFNCPDSLESIGNSAFNGCTSLGTVYFNSGLKTIGERVFEGCTSLDNVTIPAKLESMGLWAFHDCTGMRNLKFETGAKCMGRQAFQGCTSLTNIGLTGTLETIEGYAFKGCTALQNINIPQGIKYILDGAFQDCTRLENVYFLASPTVETFGFGAFQGCINLRKVNIPDSVENLMSRSFGYKDLDNTIDGFTLYASSGTTGGTEAKRYAEKNGFQFVDLNPAPAEPTPENPNPEQPTGVPFTGFNKVNPTGKGSITCFWNRNVAATAYEIQYSTDKSFKKDVKKVYIKYQSTVSKKISRLKRGTYYFRIRAERSGKYAKWSGTTKVRLTKGYDLTPTELSGVKTSKKGQVTVTWKKNTEGKGYQLQHTTDKKFKKNIETLQFTKSSTTKSVFKKLKKNTYHYFRIRTISGKKTSAWSEIKSVRTPK